MAGAVHEFESNPRLRNAIRSAPVKATGMQNAHKRRALKASDAAPKGASDVSGAEARPPKECVSTREGSLARSGRGIMVLRD